MMVAVISICVAACIGALARWQLGVWLNPPPADAGTVIPLGTLTVNLVGGYLIGVCVAVFQAMPQLDPVWRLALITGFLGTLTTFSSFSAEVIAMFMQQRYALALGTIAVHLLGSLTLTLLGIRSATWVLALR
jgi:CrcB protein